MGSKFLLFLMLYLVVDVSLVLSITGKFETTKSCSWKSLGHLLRVTCDDSCIKGHRNDCNYYGDPRECQWYKEHKEEYFQLLVNDLKDNVDHSLRSICNDEYKLHVKHCKGVYYSPRL